MSETQEHTYAWWATSRTFKWMFSSFYQRLAWLIKNIEPKIDSETHRLTQNSQEIQGNGVPFEKSAKYLAAKKRCFHTVIMSDEITPEARERLITVQVGYTACPVTPNDLTWDSYQGDIMPNLILDDQGRLLKLILRIDSESWSLEPDIIVDEDGLPDPDNPWSILAPLARRFFARATQDYFSTSEPVSPIPQVQESQPRPALKAVK
jgi:hypothetical protein